MAQFKLLTPGFNTQKTLQPPLPAAAVSTTKIRMTRSIKRWWLGIGTLLICFPSIESAPRNQDLLLEKGVTAQSFISWLLYAASQGGSGIRDPIGHAVSRLIQDPSRGAGGVFERLAGLPADELIDLLTREMSGASPWNTDWSTAMADAPRTRLRALADQLGVPVPKANDW